MRAAPKGYQALIVKVSGLTSWGARLVCAGPAIQPGEWREARHARPDHICGVELFS